MSERSNAIILAIAILILAAFDQYAGGGNRPACFNNDGVLTLC